MLDDLRNHDPSPTEMERGWMDADLAETAVRVVVLAGISVAIGVAVSLAPDSAAPPATATALAAH